MPLYEYECPECGDRGELVAPMKDKIPETVRCTNSILNCHGTMHRIYGFRTPADSYSKPLISDALAVHPSQIAEHRGMFPDIKVHSDGRPEFTSFKQHEKYLEATGFVKQPQKKRRTLKKIKNKAT